MKLSSTISLIVFIVAAFSRGMPSYAQSPAANPQMTGIGEGLWEGTIALKQVAVAEGSGPSGKQEGQGSLTSELSLRILSQGAGALMDITAQSMFGYPLDEVSWSSNRIRFSLDALGPGEELLFDGFYSASTGAVGLAEAGTANALTGGTIVGTAKAASWRGSFMLRRTKSASESGEKSLSVITDEGALPGTLLLPTNGQTRFPLVLLLAGAGTTDRNGNNYNVPGRSDSLKMLAKALASKGVASYRYDKRGSGEAYMLERQGVTTSLGRLADDAVKALRLLQNQEGIARIIVAGMNEGAWIGAAAINRLAAEGIVVDGLIALDSSGEEPIRGLEASLEELDETTRAEADTIVKAIIAGKPFQTPTGQLSDFFAASRLAWLKSWLTFDPAAEMARVEAPILYVYGSSDMQVSPAAFERLRLARPDAAARLIPSMNYMLKQVKTEQENYDSFTNPAYPLSSALVDLVTAFAKAKPAPSGSTPYEMSAGN